MTFSEELPTDCDKNGTVDEGWFCLNYDGKGRFDRQSLKKSSWSSAASTIFVGSLFPSDVSESAYRTESNMTELRGLIVP